MSEDRRSEEMPDLDQTAYYVNEDGSRVRYEELLTDDELKKRISDRRKRAGRNRLRKKTRTVVLLIIVFAMLLTMCGRDIVRLKAENIELKKQQAELKEERDRLEKELKNTKNKDYIQDQARKQLRLLNEGEILFLFGDDEYSSEKGKTENNEEKKTENKE